MINLEFNNNDIDKSVKLSALFEADNFVYTTFDADNNMLSYCSGNPFDSFSDIVAKYPLSQVKVGVKTIYFGHFGSTDRIPLNEGKIFIDKMTGQDIWCSYESPFTPDHAKIRHFSTIINHHYFLVKEKVFHIHFDESKMHFYVQIDGEIVLYNEYPMDEVDDLLYYHSFISQSLNVDTQIIPLMLSGKIEMKSKAYTQLSPFHDVIEFVNVSNTKIITDRDDLKPYHFFDHIMNIQCG